MPGTIVGGRGTLLSPFPPRDGRHRVGRKGHTVGIYLKKAIAATALAGKLSVTERGDISCSVPIPVGAIDFAVYYVEGHAIVIYDSSLALHPIVEAPGGVMVVQQR